MTMTKITAKTRRQANRSLGKLGLRFHATPGLALAAILEALEPFGIAFGLVFQPKTGTTRNVVQSGESEVANTLLVVQTHEMESGSVELNTYLS